MDSHSNAACQIALRALKAKNNANQNSNSPSTTEPPGSGEGSPNRTPEEEELPNQTSGNGG